MRPEVRGRQAGPPQTQGGGGTEPGGGGGVPTRTRGGGGGGVGWGGGQEWVRATRNRGANAVDRKSRGGGGGGGGGGVGRLRKPREPKETETGGRVGARRGGGGEGGTGGQVCACVLTGGGHGHTRDDVNIRVKGEKPTGGAQRDPSTKGGAAEGETCREARSPGGGGGGGGGGGTARQKGGTNAGGRKGRADKWPSQ
uniref:Uncharacterized protein n=1 Tax=Knipowitschia caucasica TaxID=637954 RepID=A0AAV2KWZ3_KNICA